MIKGYAHGADITLLDATYIYPECKEDGKYTDDKMVILYKDNVSGFKKIEVITKPIYKFYKAKNGTVSDYNMLFIEEDAVEEYVVPYRDLFKSIAQVTNNMEFYNNNVKNRDMRANKQLNLLPEIFNSDMNIEDAYRFYFDQEYENRVIPVSKAFLDIEVDTNFMMGDFPEKGECPFTVVTYININTKHCATFAFRNPANPAVCKQIDSFSSSTLDELKEFVNNHIGEDKMKELDIADLEYDFFVYEDEIILLQDLFRLINFESPDFLTIWNMPFDMPYNIERIVKLGHNPVDILCDPLLEEKYVKYYIDTRNEQVPAERCDYFLIAGHTIYVDQLVQFASRRKGQSNFDSFKLDYIASVTAKIRKLDWSHLAKNFNDFTNNHFKTLWFYNVIDVIDAVGIEKKTGDIDYLFAKCLMNNTRYSKAHRQTIYLANRGIKEFRKEGYIMGNNSNINNEKPPKFPGALVGDPLNNNDYAKIKINGTSINVEDNLDDFDFKSLYPSTMREFNIAPNTQIGKIEIDHPVFEYENPFSYDKYSRGGQFIEDYRSGNILEFAKRWLHLAGYMDMIQDMEEYFSMYGCEGYMYEHSTANVIKNVYNTAQSVIQPIYYDTPQSAIIKFDQPEPNYKDIVAELSNKVQLDTDNIDMIMRRKAREREEDEEASRFFNEFQTNKFNNAQKVEE